jgi:hypothetical protein
MIPDEKNKSVAHRVGRNVGCRRSHRSARNPKRNPTLNLNGLDANRFVDGARKPWVQRAISPSTKVAKKYFRENS